MSEKNKYKNYELTKAVMKMEAADTEAIQKEKEYRAEQNVWWRKIFNSLRPKQGDVSPAGVNDAEGLDQLEQEVSRTHTIYAVETPAQEGKTSKTEAVVTFPEVSKGINRKVQIPISKDGNTIYLKKSEHYINNGVTDDYKPILQREPVTNLRAAELDGDFNSEDSITSLQSGKYYQYETQASVTVLEEELEGYELLAADEVLAAIENGRITDANTIATLFRSQIRDGRPPIWSLPGITISADSPLKTFQHVDDDNGFDEAQKAGRVTEGEDDWIWTDSVETQSGKTTEVVVSGDETTTIGISEGGQFLIMLEPAPTAGHKARVWTANGANSDKLVKSLKGAAEVVVVDNSTEVAGAELAEEVGQLTKEELDNVQFTKIGKVNPIPNLSTTTNLVLATGLPADIAKRNTAEGADEPLDALGYDFLSLQEMLQMVAYGFKDSEGNIHQLDDRLVCGVAMALTQVSQNKDNFTDLARIWNLN